MSKNNICFLFNCVNAIENTNAKFVESIYEKDDSFQSAEEFIESYICKLLLIIINNMLSLSFFLGLDGTDEQLIDNYEKFEDIAFNKPLLITTIVKVFLSKLETPLISKNLLNTCISNPSIVEYFFIVFIY